MRCLLHRLDQFPALSRAHTSLQKWSHSHKIWLPHALLHSGSPLQEGSKRQAKILYVFVASPEGRRTARRPLILGNKGLLLLQSRECCRNYHAVLLSPAQPMPWLSLGRNMSAGGAHLSQI